MMSTLPVLQTRLILGLETEIDGNIHYLSDNEVVYPVGGVVAIHNFIVRKQKIIRLPDKGRNLTQIVVSPNKKLIATLETSDKLPVCTLWCADTLKKKRVLNFPEKEITCDRYVSGDFTSDSKRIVLITGDPDYSLYCYKTDRGRLESSARANNSNQTGTVTQVCCNPSDSNQLALIGDSVLRCMGYQDFIWRQFGYNKIEPVVYTSCCWLSQDRLIVGSSRGKILILETGELRAIFHASDMPVINMKLNTEEKQPGKGDSQSELSLKSVSSAEMPQDDEENYEIRSLINFPRGFAFGYMNGRIHLYERETPHKFRKRSTLWIPDHTIPRDSDDLPKESKRVVRCVRVNNAQDRMIATCNEPQIFCAQLWASEENDITMYDYGYALHFGPISGMAVSRWKPILITAGAVDRQVKIWNYETDELLLRQNFEDDICSVALHPTGLYAAIGFSHKLCFATILINEISLSKDFNVRRCKLVKFSTLGHLFAATNCNVIQVYSSVTFDLMYVLKGHSGEVTGISWSANDNTLASCASDGAIYEWDVVNSSRRVEIILKMNQFTGIHMTSQCKEMYVIAKDGHIKELINAIINRDLAITPPNEPLDGLVMSQLDNMLFVTGNEGTVYVVKLPLSDKAEYIEYMIHKTTITSICMTYDDRFMATASVDGCICVWRLLNVEEKAIKLDKEIASSSEVLISHDLLEEQMEKINILSLRLKELETEHFYQMRQNETVFSLKMKDIHEQYCNAIDELKIKNEQMEGDHVQEINVINAQINKTKQDHAEFVKNLETTYNEKLIIEYKKYWENDTKLKGQLKNLEAEYEALKTAKAKSEENLIKMYEIKLRDKDDLLDEQREKNEKNAQEHELIKQQIEDDCDREIYEMKSSHSRELKEEQDMNIQLRGEARAMKKKMLASQKQGDEYKYKCLQLESEQSRYKSIIMGLEKDIQDIKKQIQERDNTIEEKEKRIFQLKSKNMELEKFKFILDFKIKELKSQIEPKERTIQDQILQINEMVGELENLQKAILNLDLQMSDLRARLTASNNEVRKEIEKNKRMKAALQAIRLDLHEASNNVQNVPMLKKAVTAMYHKYNADKDFEIAQAEDADAKNEFLRQRDFLERTVNTLHAQATKNTSSISSDKIRLVDENAMLLVETNHLRTSLQAEINQNRKLNSLMGMAFITPKIARKKINMAIATNEEIHAQYEEKIKENNKAIEALKEENERLMNKITEEWVVCDSNIEDQ